VRIFELGESAGRFPGRKGYPVTQVLAPGRILVPMAVAPDGGTFPKFSRTTLDGEGGKQ